MVIAINGPFYYLLQVEERMQALKNVFNSLKPGGIIFLDLANFIYYLSHYNPGKIPPLFYLIHILLFTLIFISRY